MWEKTAGRFALGQGFTCAMFEHCKWVAIGRFAVVPLSEDCGFIEWVPQTVTLRNVCTEVYAAEGLTDMKSTLASVHSTYKNFSVRAPLSLYRPIHSSVRILLSV